MIESITRNRNEAVRAACKDAQAKGKLGIVAMMYAVPESALRKYIQGDDTELTESQLEWLAVDLRV